MCLGLLTCKGSVMGKKKKGKKVEAEKKQLTWDTTRLRKFIQDELEVRDWTMQKLSEEMSVSHTKVGRFLNGETNITLSFLEEFSRATNVDIRVLVALLFPDLVHAEKPDVMGLTDMILRLSPGGQRRLKRLIVGLLQDEGSGENSEK